MDKLDTAIVQRVMSFLSLWVFPNFTTRAFTALLLIDFIYTDSSRQNDSSLAEIICRGIHRFIVFRLIHVSPFCAHAFSSRYLPRSMHCTTTCATPQVLQWSTRCFFALCHFTSTNFMCDTISMEEEFLHSPRLPGSPT